MTRHRLLSNASREAFFSIPFDMGSLQQYYLLSNADFVLIRTRRGDENQLDMAIHIAILRHPGQGWQKGTSCPKRS